jgi:probable addiction module antidote protein
MATMTLHTTRFDSAQYLQTEEDIHAYIEACMQEGGDDPAFIAHALGVVARARNMSQVARDAGLSREGLYKALAEGANPSLETVWRLARALGFELTLKPAGPPG